MENGAFSGSVDASDQVDVRPEVELQLLVDHEVGDDELLQAAVPELRSRQLIPIRQGLSLSFDFRRRSENVDFKHFGKPLPDFKQEKTSI